MNVEVIDGFLSEEDNYSLLKVMMENNKFSWRPSRCLTERDYDEDPRFNLQFTHIFYTNGSYHTSDEFYSEHYDYVKPIVDKLDIDILVKIKANLTVNRGRREDQGFHMDMPVALTGKGKTAIYYVNGTNGGTRLDQGEFIEGVSNRLVILPNNIRHTAVSHDSNSPMRLVLNINWIYQKYFVAAS